MQVDVEIRLDLLGMEIGRPESGHGEEHQQREEGSRVAIAGGAAGARRAQWLPSQSTMKKKMMTPITRSVTRCHESGLSPATSPVCPFTRNR